MAYLIGRFKRDREDDIFRNKENPMSLVGIVEHPIKQQLMDAKSDEEYQIINLETMEYFDPVGNTWRKIQKWS